MKHQQKPVRYLAHLIATMLACFAMLANAEESPPQPALLETFTCNYNNGKDRGDLLAARDYYLKQAAKAEIKPEEAFLWEPFKAAAPVDFIWLAVHDNLSAFGASTAAGMASSDMASANARFATVATCSTGLAEVRTIHAAAQAPDTAPALISTATCKARGENSSAAINDLRNHINGTLNNMDAYKNVALYSAVPMTSGPDSPDVYIFSVHDSVAGWAKRTSEFSASDGGQRLRRHFDSMLDCDNGLWLSERVVEAAQ